jgi:hypothetical protein
MKTHKHHIQYKSQGGSDDPSNLIEIDFIEHARLHALDFIEGGAWFDNRHKGWPYLETDLRNAIKAEQSRRTTERNLQDNPAKYPESRRKIGEAHKGKTLTPDQKKACGSPGELHPNYGKNLKPETKQLISNSRKGQRNWSIPITLILPTGEEEFFESMADACKKYNLTLSKISAVVNGSITHTKGFKARRV